MRMEESELNGDDKWLWQLSTLRVWLSGGTGGLGLKIAERLVKSGCFGLAVTDIKSQEEGDRIVQQLLKLSPKEDKVKLFYLQVDVRDEKAIESSMREAVRLFGGLDAVVNNAGVSDENDLIHTMQVNAIGCIRATEAALRIFKQIKKEAKYDNQELKDNDNTLKVVLNISSASGLFPFPNGEYYSASKHAVVGYSKSIAAHALKQGVCVVCLCPAWIDVGMGMHAFSKEKEKVQGTGLKTMKAIEVTRVVVHLLCSRDLPGKIIFMADNMKPCLALVYLSKRPFRQSKL